MKKEFKNFVAENNYPDFELKAVLFDMDGVLYNSMPAHAIAWERIMKKHGMNLSQKDVYINEGRTGKSTIKLVCNRQNIEIPSDEEINKIYAEKTCEFNKFPAPNPMNGSAELLKKIKQQGLFSMVITGSGQTSLINKLNNDFPDIFVENLMVTAFDVKHDKPHPEPYLLGLGKGNINAWNAIVVENAPLGVRAARSAGIFTIAVNTGILPDKILYDSGANLLYPDMQELYNDWDNISENIIKSNNC